MVSRSNMPFLVAAAAGVIAGLVVWDWATTWPTSENLVVVCSFLVGPLAVWAPHFFAAGFSAAAFLVTSVAMIYWQQHHGKTNQDEDARTHNDQH